jgi:cysteine sulfinate desulfinase/cysteine desulfurase-like protein
LLDLNEIAVGYDDLFEKSLIISLSKFNSFEEIDIFVKKLKEII